METKVTGRIGLLAWQLLEANGIDPVPHFARWGLTRADLEDKDCRLGYGISDVIWRETQALIEDPCAGLLTARLWHPSTFGVLGYAMLVSSTLRRALERLIRYQHMVAEESRVSMQDTPGGVVVRNDNARHQSGDWPLLVDVAITFWLAMLRFNFGEHLNPVAVNLMRPRPGCADRYEAFFRCPVRFSARENSLVLPHATMDELLPTRDRDMAMLHDKVMQQYMAQQRRDEWLNRVREEIIANLPSGKAEKDLIAAALHMSSSTLLRRLKEKGTNFADLVSETRKDLALDYLADDNLALVEISYLLGFADSSTFSRAFKRWTGRTPLEARHQA